MPPAPDDARIYYVIRRPDLAQEGPYTTAEMRRLLRSGWLGSQSCYWHEGLADWLPFDAAAQALFAPPRSSRPLVLALLILLLLLAAGFWALRSRLWPSPAPVAASTPSPTPPTATPAPAPVATPVATPTPPPVTQATPRPTPPILSVVEITRELRPAVGHIKVFKEGKPYASGTGWMLSQDGIFVTNYHVVEDSLDFAVSFGEGPPLRPQSFIYADRDRDFAVFRLPGEGHAAVRLRPADEPPQEGEEVVVVGNPQGFEGTVTTGVLSGTQIVHHQSMIQMSAAISPGSSGSPVADNRGRVLAMATMTYRNGQSLNFAVPLTEITRALSYSWVKEVPVAQLKATRLKRDQTNEELEGLARRAKTSRDIDQIVTRIEEAKKEFPNDPVFAAQAGWLYYRLNMPDQVDETFRPWLSLTGGHEVEILGAYADILLCWKRHAEAEKLAAEFVEIQPESAYAWELLGNSYSGLNRTNEAIAALKKALDLDPKRLFPLFELGRIYAVIGQYSEAIWYFKKALDLDPARADLMSPLISCYYKVRMYAEAAALGERYVKAYPRESAAWAQLALSNEGLGRYQRAAECLEKAVALQPRAKAYWVFLAAMYSRSGRPADAQRASRQASTLPELAPSEGLLIADPPVVRRAVPVNP